MDNLLMIFVKNPVAGKVKTRIAATMGDQIALEIYKKLLKHTLDIAKPVKSKKAVYYSDFIPENDEWLPESFASHLQKGVDLGERMQTAFANAFRQNFRKVIVIGSDCPELTPEIIDHAFIALDNHDVVIGPAADGGYYLLGMKQVYFSLFEDLPWSTASVSEITINKCKAAGLSVFLLPVLSDVDIEKDVPPLLLSHTDWPL